MIFDWFWTLPAMFLSHRQQTGKTFNRLWEIWWITKNNKKYFIFSSLEFRIVQKRKQTNCQIIWDIIIFGIFFLLVLLLLCTLFCPSTHVILLCYFVTWEGKRKRYGYAFPSQIGSKGNTEIQYYLHNVNIMLC